MRSLFRISALFQLCIGLLQLGAGAGILLWAWPLFADPPFLGHGLERMFASVSDLLRGNPAASKPLSTLRDAVFWLFERNVEGELIGLFAGFLLVLSGIASLVLALRRRAGASSFPAPSEN